MELRGLISSLEAVTAKNAISAEVEKDPQPPRLRTEARTERKDKRLISVAQIPGKHLLIKPSLGDDDDVPALSPSPFRYYGTPASDETTAVFQGRGNAAGQQFNNFPVDCTTHGRCLFITSCLHRQHLHSRHISLLPRTT